MSSRQNKVALVTGASSGIGKAIALRLAADGFDIALSYNQNVSGAQQTCDLIRLLNQKALALPCNLASVSEIEKLIKAVLEKFGQLDVLVNNASISNTKPLDAIDESEWDLMLDTNLKGTFFCSKFAFQTMKEVGRGRMISITSIAGERGGFFSGIHYSASKGGITAMMKSFALVGAAFQITANCVAPGVVATEMAIAEGLTSEGIPIGRMAKPEEVAAAVSFLASEKAGYITGTTIDVNGGQLMR